MWVRDVKEPSVSGEKIDCESDSRDCKKYISQPDRRESSPIMDFRSIGVVGQSMDILNQYPRGMMRLLRRSFKNILP